MADALPLETRSLRLRHFVPDDVVALHRLSDEATSRAWLPSQVYRDRDHARAVLDSLIAHYSVPGNPAKGPYVLGIEDRSDGTLIGHVGFSPLWNDVEIGFSIAEQMQGQGLATEAVIAAVRWAFENFGMERIVGVTSARNVASMRVLEHAGFVHERDTVMNFQGSEQEVTVWARTLHLAMP